MEGGFLQKLRFGDEEDENVVGSLNDTEIVNLDVSETFHSSFLIKLIPVLNKQ